MRWARFTVEGNTAYGIVEGDEIRGVDGSPFAEYTTTDRAYPLSAVKLEVPVIPPTFYCVGFNYPKHVLETAAQLGHEPVLPTQPDVGYRAVNALIAHQESVVIPRDATEQINYEGELAVVIGRQAKHLAGSRRAVLRAWLHHRQ